ncbi:MAG: dTDP-4-dehydrorhamnose reductase [Desulfobacterales bacterium]|nr:MAG: dTDP-4-dehydrorhamnose reductase [Desulfobacterales bacterium]
MKRILITGANGQLGRELTAAFSGPCDLVTAGRPDLDITDPAAVNAFMDRVRPDLLLNAAAYTAVDRAEEEMDRAFAANGDAPGYLAEACARTGAAMIHFSTDFVFDGESETPYRETDPAAPLSVYGKSKLAGEQTAAAALDRLIILRTSWLYSPFGRNFISTILEKARTETELRVVADQQGCPTAAEDLAAAARTIADRILSKENDIPWGVYHWCNQGVTSWHGLAEITVHLMRGPWNLACRRVIPIPSVSYPLPARRPAFSALDCSAADQAFGVSRPLWIDALHRTLGRMHADRRIR